MINLHAGVRENPYREQSAGFSHECFVGYDDGNSWRYLTRNDSFERIDVGETVQPYDQPTSPDAHDPPAFEPELDDVLAFIVFVPGREINYVFLNHDRGKRLQLQVNRRNVARLRLGLGRGRGLGQTTTDVSGAGQVGMRCQDGVSAGETINKLSVSQHDDFLGEPFATEQNGELIAWWRHHE